MPYRIKTRAPRGNVPDTIETITDTNQLDAVEHDAANYPGGKAFALVKPRSEAEISAIVQRYPKILPIGAQSSVTGGATPHGELLFSFVRHDRILERGTDYVRVQAGLALRTLREALALEDKYYPPVPSYDGATIGGVLASGEVLDIERGQCHAHLDGYFEIEEGTRRYRLPNPFYQMPQMPKCSAGYYAAPGMDLIDLFIGSEGTLGVITEATLHVVSPRPGICVALVPCLHETQALALTRTLRELSLKTRTTDDQRGLDVSAVEYMDVRSLQILREDGSDRRNAITLSPDVQTLLLIQLELSPASVERAYDDLAQALEPDAPLVHFVRVLEQNGGLEETELVMPGEMQLFREGFEAYGLDYAIWGHASDGNMHPNLLPHSLNDVEQASKVIVEVGREVIALDGCPLAEHGVGRNSTKQALLKALYGVNGLRQMVAVKRALDPDGKLAPGNLFGSVRR